MSASVEQRGHLGLGAKLSYSLDGGTMWNEIARIDTIGDLEFGEAEKKEVTGFDSGRTREYIKGLKEPAELDLEGFWTGHASQYAIMEMDDVIDWKFELPGGLGAATTKGFMSSFKLTLEPGEPIKWGAKLVLSGEVDFEGPEGEGGS